MQTLAEIKQLLAERGLSPKHALGQNFLIDHNLIAKLVDDAGVAEGDLVLEVGPGTGTLTRTLLERGARVVAVELDAQLAALLRDTLGRRYPDAFTLIEGDCLAGKRALNEDAARLLADAPFKLVANLPYGAATPLMLVLLTRYPNCRGLWVTIQNEVADRLLAGPGSKDYGAISIVAQALCDVRRIATLPRECFWPRPDVTSAMLAAVRRADPLVDPASDAPQRLADLAQQLFMNRRKQLGGVLKRLGLPPEKLPEGVAPTHRAENLRPAQIVAML